MNSRVAPQNPREARWVGSAFQLALSLDGFASGSDQSEENPLGVGGMELLDYREPG